MADEWEAERIVTALRADGELAVSRPDDGVRLEEWRRHTAPLTFADRLTLTFAWSEHDRHGLPGVIELGLGGFGSGQHPTTRLLIEELLTRITGGERVLDVGCGSGVLGLAALALGASHLTAVDVKPDAVDATRRNAVLNGMGERVEATHGAARTDRRPLRRRRGQRRAGGDRGAGAGVAAAAGAGGLARRERLRAVAGAAGRRVPPPARRARAAGRTGAGRRSCEPSAGEPRPG